jgi:dihydrolipoamide dehydrogenase
MAKQFDVVVIGGGPGGYVAAIRAAQLGFSTACCESESYADPKGEVRLGGTCLNVGCIPSKALLQSSEHFDNARHGFVMHGISTGDIGIDVKTMVKRKDNIVTQLTGGIKGLFKKNKVTLLPGHGKFTGGGEDGWEVDVAGEVVTAKHVIVATGSRPRYLDGISVDNKLVCDNVGALAFDAVPKRLGVIGAGVIGLELGSVWKRLGAEVTILEALPEFLAAADAAVAREAWKVFTKKQGLDIRLGVKINKVTTGKKGITVEYDAGDESHVLECDRLIVSVGRVPNTEGLGCEAVGLQLDERGRVDVDDHCRSNLPNVWAVGDVVRGPMLAHKGMEEGVMVAELIAGQAGHCNYDAVPWVIYTHPEIAWVGRTEEQLKRAGIEYRAGQIPFAANGRALGQGDTTGFVKMLADAKTDRILGVHVIGTNASELISEAVVAMEFHASSEDIARIVHAHPTLSEVMHEAALAVDKRPLHF